MGEFAQTLLKMDELKHRKKYEDDRLVLDKKIEERLNKALDISSQQFNKSHKLAERQETRLETASNAQVEIAKGQEGRESRAETLRNNYLAAQTKYMDALSDVAADTMLKEKQKELVNQQAALTEQEARGLKMKYDNWDKALSGSDEALKQSVKNEMFGLDMNKQMDQAFKQQELQINTFKAIIDGLNLQRQVDQDKFNKITGLLSGLLGAEAQAALKDVMGKDQAKNVTKGIANQALGSGAPGAEIPVLNLSDPNAMNNMMNQFLGGD